MGWALEFIQHEEWVQVSKRGRPNLQQKRLLPLWHTMIHIPKPNPGLQDGMPELGNLVHMHNCIQGKHRAAYLDTSPFHHFLALDNLNKTNVRLGVCDGCACV